MSRELTDWDITNVDESNQDNIEKGINFSKHLTPDDWGDPQGATRTDLLIALTLLLLYPLCFGSGMMVAHFFGL